jgi:lipopolysaccharide transport system permease protein
MAESLHDEFFGHQHVTVIAPSRRWSGIRWREIWAYRELLWVLAVRDVKVRYKQTVLGASWAIVRPLLTMLIFSLVFGRLAKMPSDGYPYPIFVYAGLLPWTFFSSAVTSAAQSLVSSSGLVSKIYFPRLIIPVASIGAVLVDLLVSTVVLLLMMLWYHVGWTPKLIAAPILIVALLCASLGVGLLLSALTVSYRDVTHITPFLVQVWMYVTPVLFPVTLFPQRWRALLYVNPMTGLIEAFRSVFLGKPIDWSGLGLSSLVVAIVLAAGLLYFEKVERRFADVI